jgi:hypothetical protein
MTENSSSSRFKAEMPQIPGITPPPTRPARVHPLLPVLVGVVALGIILVFALGWFLHSRPEPVRVESPPQIEVPPPPPDPNAALPHADEAHPVIAELAQLAKPWSSLDFFIKNKLTGENIPATIIRLPGGSANNASGYWAFTRKAPYGDCQLQYVSDLSTLQQDYDFRAATHPLVGNPCSRTLYDPLKTSNLPGNVWVRGGIVQGSDIRPPFGVEIRIQGKQILATRTE